jgi:hypothetical protein
MTSGNVTFSEEIPIVKCTRASSVVAPVIPSGHIQCIEGAAHEGQTMIVKNSFLTIVTDDALTSLVPERLTKSIDLAFLDYKMDNLIMTCDAQALGFEEKVRTPCQLEHTNTVGSFSTYDGDDCDDWRSSMNRDFSSICESQSQVEFLEEDSDRFENFGSSHCCTESSVPTQPQSLIESWRLNIVQQRIQHEHICGECKPCAFAHKPEGCLNGDNCTFCHEAHSPEYIKLASKKNRAKRLTLLWAQKEASA